MKYVVIGSDIEKAESWMLHGIYMNRPDAEMGALRNARSEITPERYHYSVVEIAEKEMELFRSLPADPMGEGSGNVEAITIALARHGHPVDKVSFTNIPMERVHAAIGVLNGDVPDYGKIITDFSSITFPEPPEPSHIRMEDFTITELFPVGKSLVNTQYGAYSCTECAALTGNMEVHTAWHNKLLP